MDNQLEERSATGPWRQGLQLCLIIVAVLLLLTRPYLVTAIRANVYSPVWLLVGPFLFLGLFLTFLTLEFFSKKRLLMSASDYLRALFGILVIALLFPSSFREYRVRKFPDPMRVGLIEQFSTATDARIRALAMLASSRHNFHDKTIGALLHKGLLDKDPLVQQAAKLVIEDNFGIRLKNGAEGIHQAQSLIRDVGPEALLMKKGLP